MAERVPHLLAATLVGLGLAGASAESLRDPLRPPPGLGQDLAPHPATDGPIGDRPPLRLQSTLVGPGRAIAIINGERVAEGRQIGDAVVVRIRPGQVDLSRGEATLTLRLVPGVAPFARSPGTAKELQP